MGNKVVGEDNLEVYTPDIGDSEDIGIDESITSYSPRLNRLKEGETIQVKLNEKAIKWRISHDLYKDYKSGVRELFQNEARACRQARDKYNAKPHIEVRIDNANKQISIDGIDSLGISESVFDNVLRVLGVSGNTDGGNEVGQFGMGFASYTTISDVIMVETWYRENRDDGSEHKYAFLGDNGIDFKVLPEPVRETYGTKVSMTYNNKVEVRGIVDMLSECAKFCGIKTTLIIDDSWHEYHEYGQEGIYELETYESLSQCLELQIHDYSIKQKILNADGTRNIESSGRIDYFKKVHIDNEDYEFVGLIAMENIGTTTINHNFVSGSMNYHLLANVPIEINFNSDGKWTCYALNIKNERKFMPTADRDRLTQEAETHIQEAYNIEITKHFDELKLETINDYTVSLNKPIYDYISRYESMFDNDSYEATRQVVNTLSRYFTTGGNRTTPLKNMLASGKPVIRLKALRGEYIARINTKIDDGIYFRYKSNDERGDDKEERYENTLMLLQEAGVIFGEEYIKEHKIRPLTKKEKTNGVKIACRDKPVRLWNSGYRRHHGVDGEKLFGQAKGYRRGYISSTVGQVNDNAHDLMLMCPKDKDLWDSIKSKLWSSQAGYVLIKTIKGIDTEEINTYEDWLSELKTRKITLADGTELLPKELDKEYYNIVMCDKKSVTELTKKLDVNSITKYEDTILVETQEEYFEMLCLMGSLKKYESHNGFEMDNLIQESSGIDLNTHTFYCNDDQRKIIYGKLPKYQDKLPNNIFEVFMYAVSSKPYDFELICNHIDESYPDKE